MVKQGQANYPKEALNYRSPIEKAFKVVKRENDPRFGDIQIVQNPQTSQRFLMKEKITNSDKDFGRDVTSARRRMTLNHPGLQHMEDYSTATKSDFCSKHYTTRGYYQYPRTDLRAEMMARKKNLNDFNHEELTNMTYQNLDALAFLHKQGCAFEDIRPEYIGFGDRPNHYFLCDRLNNPSNAQVANTQHFLANRPLYCSPKIWKGICNKEKNIQHNPYKSDSWSLGMTILEAGTHNNVQDIYDRDDKKVKSHKLDAHLHHFREKYGHHNSLLCDMVENCLLEDEDKRYDATALLEQVPPYGEIQSHFKNSNHEHHVEHHGGDHHGEHRVEHHVEHVHHPEVVEYKDEHLKSKHYDEVVVVKKESYEKPKVHKEEKRVYKDVAPVEVRREVIRLEPEIIRSEVPAEYRREYPKEVKKEKKHKDHYKTEVRRDYTSEVRRVEAPTEVRRSYNKSYYVDQPVEVRRSVRRSYRVDQPVEVRRSVRRSYRVDQPVEVRRSVRRSYRVDQPVEVRRSYTELPRQNVVRSDVVREPVRNEVVYDNYQSSRVVRQDPVQTSRVQAPFVTSNVVRSEYPVQQTQNVVRNVGSRVEAPMQTTNVVRVDAAPVQSQNVVRNYSSRVEAPLQTQNVVTNYSSRVDPNVQSVRAVSNVGSTVVGGSNVVGQQYSYNSVSGGLPVGNTSYASNTVVGNQNLQGSTRVVQGQQLQGQVLQGQQLQGAFSNYNSVGVTSGEVSRQVTNMSYQQGGDQVVRTVTGGSVGGDQVVRTVTAGSNRQGF